MRYFILLLLMAEIIFSQNNSYNYSANAYLLNIIKPQKNNNITDAATVQNLKIGIISGEKIINTGKDEYWIKNVKLITTGGQEFLFADKLYIDNKQLLDQVSSNFGYIIVFPENSNTFEVYISDVNGIKDSDAVEIIYK